MKKIILLLLLFCAKSLSAQQLYLGGSYAFSIDNFRQVPDGIEMPDLNWGICTQYTFGKNSPFGYEGDLICDLFGPNKNQVSNNPAPGFTAINYVFLNPFYFFPQMSFQFKAGFFYSHYFTQYIEPRNDYGPALAINLLLRVSKKSYWGVEFSKLFGLANYYVLVPTDLPLGFVTSNPDLYYNPRYSNIIYNTLSLKFVYRIDKQSAK